MRRSRPISPRRFVAIVAASLSTSPFATGCGGRANVVAIGTSSSGGAPGSFAHPIDASTGSQAPGGGGMQPADASLAPDAFGVARLDAGNASSGQNGTAAPCMDTISDSKNCGACGHDCLGGGCSAGACLPVLLHEDVDSFPQGLAVDATQVYWVDTEGTVQSVSKDGGTRTLLATVPQGPTAIALGGGALYWVSQDGTLRRLAPGDPAPVTLGSAGGESVGLALTSTTAYWSTISFGTSSAPAGAVVATPLDGGPSVPFATGQNVPGGIVASDTTVDWVDFNSELPTGSASLMQAPLDGGAPVALIAAFPGQSPGTAGIASDSSFVYVANGYLEKLPRDGGPPVLLATGYESFIAVDESGVYASAVHRIDRVPLDGGVAEPLVEQLFDPRGIALDSAAVYYTDSDAVWKLAK